jgi:sulfite exporter TauE/SafE
MTGLMTDTTLDAPVAVRVPAGRNEFTLRQRATAAVSGAIVAVLIAGFWNARLIDGFGRDVVLGRTLGDADALSTTFAQHGFGFGFLFAAAAGIAATFTACNCVVFALLPGLAASGRARADARRGALQALAVFTAGVVLVGIVYGMFIGSLGTEGVAAFNANEIRRSQARTVFTVLGVLMLVWGAIELGFLDRFTRRLSPASRAFFAEATTKAGLLGLMVGAFMVGRPFPVMRDFLTYAAAANSPLYGAAVMTVQGLGQIAVMVLLFVALVYGTGERLTSWATARPARIALVSGTALVAGGAFFVFYWGLAFTYGIGRWGFRLGWYS